METHDDRLRRIRILSGLLAALSLLIVVISAYIRLSGAGLGCAGWPDCYGRILTGGPHPHVGGVRLLHRVTAAVSLVLAFLVVSTCLRPTPIQPALRRATQLLALMILLTFVGLWSSDPHRAWITLVNILGGLALVSLSWGLLVAARPGAARGAAPATAWLPHAGLLALILASFLGALIGARYAAVTCLSTPACNGVWWPPAAGWVALNPFVMVATAPPPGDAGGVTLHLLHRYCAAAALLLLGLAAWQALAAKATRGAGGWLLALLLIDFALGSMTVFSGFNLALALGHSVCAAALAAACMQLLAAGRAASRAVV